MMDKRHLYESYKNILMPALESKVEEFGVLGYDDVDENELWTYLTRKKWKKPREGIRIHVLVEDVMSVRIGDYMNFATVEAYRSPNWFADLNNDELQALLHAKDDRPI